MACQPPAVKHPAQKADDAALASVYGTTLLYPFVMATLLWSFQFLDPFLYLVISCPSQVLYQIFDWPNQPGTRLAVIGISNTHDLDQRVLPRIASRLDQAKLAFAPYSLNQLETIVNQRLQESGVAGAVQEMAVRVTSRKVATETGTPLRECWHVFFSTVLVVCRDLWT
jgi:hypothetical protein